MPFRPFTTLGIAVLGLVAALTAQSATPPGSVAVIVHIDRATCPQRSALLERARDAVRGQRAAPWLAETLRNEAERATRAVVEAVEREGGVVRAILCSPPAVQVEVRAGLRARLARRTDVARIEPVVPLRGNTGDATGTANHHAQFVHTVNGFRGENQVLALVDSGIELNFLGGAVPHPAFLDGLGASRIVRTWSIQGATLPDLTDQNGHGTGTGSVAVGRRWNSGLAADGFAPAAAVASYRITAGTGTLTTNAGLAMAYGQILLDVIGGLRIGVANCSFSGSPDPLAVDQRALDELALFGDVLVVTSAGALTQPSNLDFRASAASQAATNGLAVGAVAKTTHQVAPFSVYGPLDGDGQRVYPDLVAVGENVHVADRASTATIAVSGTSYAAPMVAGTALLVRQARPDLDALAVKAIVLGTTADLGAANPTLSSNHYGRGLLRTDRAVAAALAALTGFGNGDPDAARIERGSAGQDDEVTLSLSLPANTAISAVLVWPRGDTQATANPDLDLDVRSASGQVLARGNLPRNLYERVVFATASAASYDFVIRGTRVPDDDAGWVLFVSSSAGRRRSPAITTVASGCPGTAIDLAAQLILPPTTGFGGARTNKPLADAPLLLQTAYDGNQVPSVQQVRALAFRRAAQEGGTAALAVRLRLTLGYTNLPPDGLSTALASNFVTTPPPVMVFDDWIDLPPTRPVPAAGEFDFVVPLSTPFTLDPNHGNPLVQIEVLGNGANNLPQPVGIDAVPVTTGTSRGALIQFTGSPFALPVDQHPVIAFVGAAPRGREPRISHGGEPFVGTTTTFALADARENTLAAFLFGTNEQWQGLSLPLDLGPYGATGCQLAAGPDDLAFVLTDAVGQAQLPVVLPNDPALLGSTRAAQFVVFDTAANAAGIVTSDAVELLIGG